MKYDYKDKIYTEEQEQELIEDVLDDLQKNLDNAYGWKDRDDCRRELHYYEENDHLIIRDFAYKVK